MVYIVANQPKDSSHDTSMVDYYKPCGTLPQGMLTRGIFIVIAI